MIYLELVGELFFFVLNDIIIKEHNFGEKNILTELLCLS